MEFLVPLFAAAGAVAAGIPLVLHMLRRAPTKRMPFTLTRFLQSAQPKFTRRSKVEHWPLLFLRILALVLLGLGFARPFVHSGDPSSDAPTTDHYMTLLIDRSASMRRSGIQEEVSRIVLSAVEALPETARLKVCLYSLSTSTVIDRLGWTTFTEGEKAEAVTQVVQEYAADWYATDTGTAIRQAAEELLQVGTKGSQRSILLVTDFQEGSRFHTLQPGVWPAAVDVDLRIVKPQTTGNASIHSLVDRHSGRSYVRVRNSVDATRSDFRLQTRDRHQQPTGTALSLTVPPGGQVSIPVSDLDDSEDAVEVILDDDVQQFDNTLPLPRGQEQLSKIAHVGSTNVNDAEQMRYYLERALRGSVPEDGLPVLLEDLVSADGVVLPVPEDARLIFLTGDVPDALLPSLKSALERECLIVAAISSMEMGQSLATLLPDGVTFAEAVVDDYAMLGRIDFEHALFADFSEARFADFSSIRFWKHRDIRLPILDESADKPAPCQVVARFDSGEPAMIRFHGQSVGQVFVLASGWHPGDSQWALSTRFAPFVSRFVDLARPETEQAQRVTVGDTLDPSEFFLSDTWSAEFPDGSTLQSTSQDAMSLTITQPGRYLLRSNDADASAPMTLLAEVDPDESRTAPLPEGQLYSLGLAGHARGDSAKSNSPPARTPAEQLESQQKYWRWCLLAGLGCLALEALLASAIERRQPEAV